MLAAVRALIADDARVPSCLSDVDNSYDVAGAACLTATGVSTAVPSASATMASCSATWTLCEPGAGLALSSRPT